MNVGIVLNVRSMPSRTLILIPLWIHLSKTSDTNVVPPLMWSTFFLSIQTGGCILSLFINEVRPTHEKPENSAEVLFGKMHTLYLEIVQERGMTYRDFLGEVRHQFKFYSTTEQELMAHFEEWSEVYSRAFSLVYGEEELVVAAFSVAPFGFDQESILSKAAYRKLTVKNALALIKEIEAKPESLGDEVSPNLAELIVQIANNYGVFRDELTIDKFNAFMAGTLATPFESSNNVKVAIFIYGLQEANLFYPGIFERIGRLGCIISSSGKGPMSGNDITSTMYQQAKNNEGPLKFKDKYKDLKRSLEGVKKAKVKEP